MLQNTRQELTLNYWDQKLKVGSWDEVIIDGTKEYHGIIHLTRHGDVIEHIFLFSEVDYLKEVEFYIDNICHARLTKEDIRLSLGNELRLFPKGFPIFLIPFLHVSIKIKCIQDSIKHATLYVVYKNLSPDVKHNIIKENKIQEIEVNQQYFFSKKYTMYNGGFRCEII